MYNKSDSKETKLVMAVRKAETETLGSGVSEARAKSAVVGLETELKVASSEPLYEAITQQIAYLKSTITNQNGNNNGENGPRCNNGNEKFPNTKTQRQRRIGKI